MDGHGGHLLLILYYFQKKHGKEALKNLKIELVDIDEGVTKWHKVMFPCRKLECLTERIVVKEVPVPKRTLVYMNFCGMAESFKEVCGFLKRTKESFRCMIGFSVERAAEKMKFKFESFAEKDGLKTKTINKDRKKFLVLKVSRGSGKK